MMTIVRELWLCVDCTMLAVNGDASSLDYHYGKDADARLARIEAGLTRLGAHLVPHWTTDDAGEISEGHRDFSSCGCDCCGSRLAGEMHRFAILAPTQLSLPFPEVTT